MLLYQSWLFANAVVLQDLIALLQNLGEFTELYEILLGGVDLDQDSPAHLEA